MCDIETYWNSVVSLAELFIVPMEKLLHKAISDDGKMFLSIYSFSVNHVMEGFPKSY